jgi:hypothetical protein
MIATPLLLVTLLAASAPDTPSIAQLWERPHDIAARNMAHGRGGKKLVPSSKTAFRFLSADTKGHSDGYEVEDPEGRRWDVKIGDEAQSECVTSRILWAIGYRQPVLHYLPRWRMEGGPVENPPPGCFRLESDHKKKGDWAWRDNPFAETRELRGLVVVNLLSATGTWPQQNRSGRWEESAPDRGPVRGPGPGRGAGAVPDDPGLAQRHRRLRERGVHRVRLRRRAHRVRFPRTPPRPAQRHHPGGRGVGLPAALQPDRAPVERRLPRRRLL